jgi:hypothetical protein
MDRKGMVQFIEDVKLLREATDAGGFRPDGRKFAAWLESLDESVLAKLGKPDTALSALRFEDLPPNLQMQFKKWLASQNLKDKPNKKIELARTLLKDLNKQLVIALRNKLQMHAGTPELADEFDAALLNLDKLQAEMHACVKSAKLHFPRKNQNP